MDEIIRSAKQLGAAIHNERVRRSLTQQALADLMVTGQKTISKIENGSEGTKLETIFTLLAALNLEFQLRPRTKSRVKMADIF